MPKDASNVKVRQEWILLILVVAGHDLRVHIRGLRNLLCWVYPGIPDGTDGTVLGRLSREGENVRVGNINHQAGPVGPRVQNWYSCQALQY